MEVNHVIAIYKRLSLSDGDLGVDGKDESNSIENQQLMIEQYLDSKEEFNGIDRITYSDDGYTGTDFNRVNLLLAVLEKRLGMQLSDCDAYVNIAGGIRMNEPAIDLGIVLAIISSKLDLTIDEKTICFGEVGLSGEVRGVTMAEQRVAEAAKLGFRRCILPSVCMDAAKGIKGIELVGVSNVREALEAIQ